MSAAGQQAAAQPPVEAGMGADIPDGLLAPIGATETGEDPRFSDRFAAVQAEVARLAGTDFGAIVGGSLALLTGEAKDLRVLGYLALGRLGESGVSGLAEALETAAALVARFGDGLHPRRASARAAALDFLAGDRMLALLERAADAGDAAARARLEAALAGLSAAVASLPGELPAEFGRLREWLNRRVRTAAAQQPAATAPARSEAGAPAPRSVDGIGDERGYHAGVRQAMSFLREQARWAEHIAMARAYRWSGLGLPPAEAGTTRIEPPRAQALAAIEQALQESRWEEGLAAAERAFLEPGGQFCLRIQWLALRCAEAAEVPAARPVIEGAVRALCARLPRLPELHFSDGSPFAAPETRAWLAQLRQEGEARRPARSTTPDDLPDPMARARECLAEHGLAQALACLEQGATPGGRAFARHRLRQARLCLEAARADLARPALAGLAEQLQRHGHDIWEPELARECLQLQREATEQDPALDARARRAELAALREAIARIDPLAGVAAPGPDQPAH